MTDDHARLFDAGRQLAYTPEEVMRLYKAGLVRGHLDHPHYFSTFWNVSIDVLETYLSKERTHNV